MALSDLTLRGMDLYGGIELKRNAKKYLWTAFGVAIGVHALIFLLYFLWNVIMSEDEKSIPRIRIKSLAELAPPPSSEETPDAAPPPPPPSQQAIAAPSFGIPVPVPDAVAPTPVMPDQAELPPGPIGDQTGPIADPGADGPPTPVKDIAPAKVENNDPGRDDFVQVESDPEPVQNIQSLVEYPDVAKRAGLEGKVIASALIDIDGRVKKVEIDKSDYKVFEDAAREALMKARFTPAKQNGQPVKVWYTLPIVFKLQTR